MSEASTTFAEQTHSPAATLRVQAAVNAKRRGETLQADTIREIIQDFVAGAITDYQMAAWLATVAAIGLSDNELVALTEAYVDGSTSLALNNLPRPVVDKHSTGGVGDKTTLIVVPIVAACGLTVVKMSGRGLGFAGGTIDKLESIPGLRLELQAEDVLRIAEEVGMVITGQSSQLAPGDGATYRLRDVTGTVESIPLIAASIMSKKIAVGSDALVLDVKTGDGALIADREQARELAQTMVRIGERMGLSTVALLSDMSQPLGQNIGNQLELLEAVSVLRGTQVPGLSETCLELATAMLCAADNELNYRDASEQARKAIETGAALDTFRRWVIAQGGDAEFIDHPEIWAPQRTLEVRCDQAGWISSVSARAVGTVALEAGAGRLRADQPIDYRVGVVVHRRVGDRVESGDLLAELIMFDGDEAALVGELSRAFSISSVPVPPIGAAHELIRASQ